MKSLQILTLSALLLLTLGFSQKSQASDGPYYLIAQSDDDSYDPFADYSEFDEASEEEADINFFKNGRFLTVGVDFGLRGFTENLNSLYSSGPTYGVFISYFFDLRLALQIGFQTGDYVFNLPTSTTNLTGNVSITMVNVDLKYYFNTQNVTKGLADINPYIIGGISQVYRTYTFTNVDGYNKQAATGVDFGAGLEVPIMRRKAFIGIQGMYHYVNFKDANSYIQYTDSSGNLNTSSSKPTGQTYDLLAVLGINF